MGKPAGNYVTIEFTDKSMYMDDKDTKKFEDKVIKEICDIITDMTNSGRKTDTEPAAEDNKGKRKQKHIWL